MSNQREIKTIADIAELTPDEFERFIPDLILWHSTLGQIQSQLGCELQEVGLLWLDDGANELKLLKLIDSKSGAEVMVKFERGAELSDEPINATPNRLELCLSACEGIDTADLKSGSVSIIHKLHDEAAKRVLAQRDEILAALKAVDGALREAWSAGRLPASVIPAHVAQQCKAAIAKVEGGA